LIAGGDRIRHARTTLARCTLACATVVLLQAAPSAAAPTAQSGTPFAPARQLVAAKIAGHPRVVVAPDGTVSIAWAAVSRSGESDAAGVFVAQRAPGATEFGVPQHVTGASTAPEIQLAVGERGDRAITWVDRGRQADGSPLPPRIAVAPPGRAFGAPEEVPVPPRVPPQVERGQPTNRAFAVPFVAVAGEGTVVLAYREADDDADLRRADLAVRHSDGSWTEAQVLGDTNMEPAVAADAGGGLHAIWANRWIERPEEGTFVYARDAGPDGRFGPAQRISTPGRAASDGNASPTLDANARGDLLAVWNSARVPTTGAPDWIELAERPAGGAWTAPRTVGEGIRPGAALNEAGDAAVAWTTWKQVPGRPNFGIGASFRPRGGAWGPEAGGWKPTASVIPVPIALSETGTAVMALARDERPGIEALERVRGDELGDPVLILTDGHGGYSSPEIAFDRYGNGLLVFVRYPRPEEQTIELVAYSAKPPVVTSFRAAARQFRFRVNEPARVTMVAKHGHRRVRQSAIARPGMNRIGYSSKARRFLGHSGRYRLTLRARDAGPGKGRPRTITIKR
jgi:hypothetical protein